MDKLQDLYEKLTEFMDHFIVKYSYENRGILKKMRIDSRLNMNIEEEEWCKLFLYKSCLNHCAKIVLMRLIEDLGLGHDKLNGKGLKKWRDFVKNLKQDFEILYQVGLLDLQGDANVSIRGIFKKSDYDIFEIDKELASLIIENFTPIAFSDLKKEDIVHLFNKLYTLEDRELMKLESFHRDAPALSYILKLDKKNALI
ncbi:hypothetical protein [Anaerosolibacter sp.]|uniref:hypothetical protein n=1 Tax=Anaerosolibacter sp. TaxID=1872527 RepID=UPI0039EFD173